MEGRQLRDRAAVALDLVGVAGLVAFALGLTWLQDSRNLGFDLAAAIDGVLGRVDVTGRAAVFVLGASVLELAAGLVLARGARRTPFDSLGEAAIAAMVAAVLKDTLLLGTLAASGLFRSPILAAVDVVIVAAAILPPLRRHVRPLVMIGSWRERVASIGSWPLAALVAIVWIGPVVLQLASPVVPFIDVLPNYVGPVEHLRTFGWFSPLTATQSPIIGPSRTVLGYDALLGAIATMTGLSGGLAVAAFILPQTVLVAAGVHRLASALRNGDPPVGAWALLAFALSQPFARLADARGTVVVVPLVCLGLAIAAELIRDKQEPDGDPWRMGRGAVIGLALGAATLVHPVIGFFAIVTVGVIGLWRPHAAAPDALVASVTAGLVTLPQLATMVGVSLPTLALGIGLPIAAALGITIGRVVDRRNDIRHAIARVAELGRAALGVGAAVVLIGAFAIAILNVDRVPAAVGQAADLALESSGLLLIAVAIGAVLGSRGARSPLVTVGLLVGVVAAGLTQVLPNNLGFLGDALRFEVPKTVHYWLSSIAAAGAAPALAFAWSGASRSPVPWAGRAVLVAAFVVVAALPVRFGNSGDDSECKSNCSAINAYHLGEHRWSESFAIDLHYAAIGFWQGFPDTRTVVDRPRQELLDALRAEINAGRLRHDTPVLHVARSFQQWIATPLGVFDGVTETFVSLDPEVGHQTVGGRLFGRKDDPVELVRQLDAFTASGAFDYVVIEPDGLPDGVAQRVEAAGYQPLFANEQGEVLRAP
jgi:hypothetical protein